MDIVSSRALRWVVVIAFGSARAAYAAEWSAQPALSVSTDYDSNRTLAPDAIGSEGVSMSGNMRLVHATERLQLLLLPDFALERFSDRRFDRSDGAGLTTEGTWNGELSSFDLSALLRDRSTLTSELLSTGIFDVHTRRRDEQLAGTWSYAYSLRWVASLFASYASQDYHGASTTLQDNTLTSFGLSEKYLASEQLAFTASLSTGHYTTQQSFFDTRSDSISAGFLWSSSERNKITGDFGWNRRTDRLSRSSGFVGQISFTRSWEAAGTLSLSAGRQVVPSGFGVFSQTDQAQISVSRGLTERLTVGAGLSWYRTTSAFESFLFEKHSYSHAQIGMTWQANEDWSIGCQVAGSRQDQLLSDQVGRGWRVALLAQWQPLKHGLSR